VTKNMRLYLFEILDIDDTTVVTLQAREMVRDAEKELDAVPVTDLAGIASAAMKLIAEHSDSHVSRARAQEIMEQIGFVSSSDSGALKT
jgi:hypothetical protein